MFNVFLIFQQLPITETCGQDAYVIGHDILINLTSPEYSKPFLPMTACTWTISATNDGFSKIDFVDFNLYAGFDFVYIGYDDTIITSLTGNVAPASIMVNTTKTMKVIFDAYLWDNGYTGFWLQLSLVPANGKYIGHELYILFYDGSSTVVVYSIL